jgi:hypothetical protein
MITRNCADQGKKASWSVRDHTHASVGHMNCFTWEHAAGSKTTARTEGSRGPRLLAIRGQDFKSQI